MKVLSFNSPHRHWANYRHLIQCHLSAGNYHKAKNYLIQFETRFRCHNIHWGVLGEIEFWVIKTEIYLLAARYDSAQMEPVSFPFYIAGSGNWAYALIDALSVCRNRLALPVELSNKVLLLEILSCEKQGRHLEVLSRIAEVLPPGTNNIPEPVTATKMLLAAGRSATHLGCPERAELFFRRALPTAHCTDSIELQAEVLVQLGHHLTLNRRIGEAVDAVMSAMNIYLRAGQFIKAAELRLQIARLQIRQGLLIKASLSYETVIEASHSRPDPTLELPAVLGLARLQLMLRQSDKARYNLLAIVRQARRLSHPNRIISAYGLLAITYSNLSFHKKTGRVLRLADRLVQVASLTPEQEIRYLIDSAVSLLSGNQIEAASRRISHATRLAESVHQVVYTVECHRLRAEVMIAKHKWRQAIHLLYKVIKQYQQLDQPYELALTEVSLGNALGQVDEQTTDKSQQQAHTSQEHRLSSRSSQGLKVPQTSSWLKTGYRRFEQIGVPSDNFPLPAFRQAESLSGKISSGNLPHRSRKTDEQKNKWAKSGIITRDKQFLDELLHMSRVARSTLPILIHGETGSGKELVAQAVHKLSNRQGSFVVFNSATCGNDLFESELFGHRKGSFTGAWRDRDGLIAQASGGTLFLDEIADLSHMAQSSLLRFLDTGEVRAIGSDTNCRFDVRIVSASYRRLPDMVESGCFRQDLFFRLAGTELNIPSLRKRRGDILLLINYFARQANIPPAALSEVLDAGFDRLLLSYSWPGNVRQLFHWVTQLAALLQGDLCHDQIVGLMKRALTAVAKATGRRKNTLPQHRSHSRPSLDRDQLSLLLKRHKGNISRIACELGTYRTHIYRLIKQNNLDHRNYRNPGVEKAATPGVELP